MTQSASLPTQPPEHSRETARLGRVQYAAVPRISHKPTTLGLLLLLLPPGAN